MAYYNFNTQPYIIINGRNSQSIKGLLIQKLPPIVKPPKRVEVEEVSGRDGDIVSVLGYGAYDLTFDIGLSYEYDIDDIIAYFDAEGTIVFSGEPNKFYKFAIYNEIDFEKLIRFRTASVTVHVQPFKYSSEEGELVFSLNNSYTDQLSEYIQVRNSGNIISRPTITITGLGHVVLYVNGEQKLAIDFPTSGSTIEVNSEDMNSRYLDGTFANRIVSGNYDKIQLTGGKNFLLLQGIVSQVKVKNFSRWI